MNSLLMNMGLASPMSQGQLYFNGDGVTTFLEHFENQCAGLLAGITDTDKLDKQMCLRLPIHCEQGVRLWITQTEEYKSGNWGMMKQKIMKEFESLDPRRGEGTPEYLEQFVN